jgi:membrane protease YdiL (CAAX protease family)
LKSIFVGPNGIRAGWRFLMWLVLAQLMAKGFVFAITHWFGYHYHEGWNRIDFLLDDAPSFLVTFAAAWVMSRIEKRRVSDYGLGRQGAFGARFWEGLLWGFMGSAVMVVLLWLAGAATFHGFNLHGRELLWSAAIWGLAMLGLGFGEEFIYRGYSLFTISTGIGFWPAAIALSALFGGLHYFLKPMESWRDPVSVGLYGLLWCLTLRRTGSLWFGIGFHAISDYSDVVLFGQPNTGNFGQPLTDRLLDIRYHGPDWLTGGPCGSEASLLVFPILAAYFVLLNWRFREARFPRAGGG